MFELLSGSQSSEARAFFSALLGLTLPFRFRETWAVADLLYLVVLLAAFGLRAICRRTANGSRRVMNVVAGFISPLCLALHLAAYLNTPAPRGAEALVWLAVPGLFATLLFSAAAFAYGRRERPGALATLLLSVPMLFWAVGLLFGLFALAVSDDPNWFH